MFFKIFKNLFFLISVLLNLTNYSHSEISSKEWSTQCSEDRKTCISIVINEFKNTEKEKMQTLATAYFQIGSTTQKKMNLVDEDDQTYKTKRRK